MKLLQLQGIRAIAIICVFITHTYMWLSDDLDILYRYAWRLGEAGVATFFILSGFLLAYKNQAIPTIDKKEIIRSAWQKVSKWYSLYLVTFAIAFIARWSDLLNGSLTNIIVKAIFNLSMTQTFVPSEGINYSFNGSSWFLSALFGIWMLIYSFPNGVNKLMNLSVYKCVVAIILIFLAQELWMLMEELCMAHVSQKYMTLFHKWLIYYNPFICFSEYCVGVVLGRCCIQRQFPIAVQNKIAGITLIVVVVYITLLLTNTIHVTKSKMIIAECFACMGITSVMSPKTIGYRLLSKPVLVWLGNISGYFFLIHGATNFAMQATIAEYIPKPWLFFISFVISTLLSAFASNYYMRKQHISMRKFNNNSLNNDYHLKK